MLTHVGFPQLIPGGHQTGAELHRLGQTGLRLQAVAFQSGFKPVLVIHCIVVVPVLSVLPELPTYVEQSPLQEEELRLVLLLDGRLGCGELGQDLGSPLLLTVKYDATLYSRPGSARV